MVPMSPGARSQVQNPWASRSPLIFAQGTNSELSTKHRAHAAFAGLQGTLENTRGAPGSDPLWAEPGAGSARMRRGRPYRCPGYTPLSLPWTVSPGPGTHAFLSFLWLLNIVGGGGKRNLRGSLQRVSEMLCRTGLPPCLPRGVREDRTSSSSLVPLPVFSRRRSTGLSRKHR